MSSKYPDVEKLAVNLPDNVDLFENLIEDEEAKKEEKAEKEKEEKESPKMSNINPPTSKNFLFLF